MSSVALLEPTALAALYDRHAPQLFSLAMRIVQDSSGAEAAVVAVFAEAWQRPNSYDERLGSVSAWLLKITREHALVERRGRGTVRAGHLSAPVIPQQDDVSLSDGGPRLTVAVTTLSALECEVVELAFYEGLGVAAIADRLGRGPAVVRSALHTGLESLRVAKGSDEHRRTDPAADLVGVPLPLEPREDRLSRA